MKMLAGIRVLDLGQFITAPFAAMLLAEMGADVVKVERPGAGDPFRSFNGGGYSPHFQAHNRNKRSLALDITRPEGLAAFKRLVKVSDVVIMNSRPGVAEKLGIGWEALSATNPRLVYCAITGFGPDGPYADRPAFDHVGQALSGWMSRHRATDDPRVVGPAITDPATSYYAALGVMGALFERERSGRGHKVEVNMLEAAMGLGVEPIAWMLALNKPMPIHQRGANSQAYALLCRDGKRIGVHLSSVDKFWESFCDAVGRPGWKAAYPSRMDRVRAYDQLAIELTTIFATRDRVDWCARLEAADVPFAPENELADLPNDPQVKHLGTFYELQHPKFGTVRSQHRPVRVDGNRDIDFRVPPDLGEHDKAVLTEAGLSGAEIEALRASGALG